MTLPESFRALVCHEEMRPISPGTLRCDECGRTVSAYEFVLGDPRASVSLADDYARATGDVNVPCRVALLGVPGIVPGWVTTTLSRLLIATRMLVEVNSPFVDRDPEPGRAWKRERVLENFLSEYVRLVTDQTDDSNVAKAVRAILLNMKDAIVGSEGPDLLERYFGLVVPYVKGCLRGPFAPVVRGPADPSPSAAFREESRLSTEVRAAFSRHCIPFDVVHVMVYCYLCSEDADAVANLVFDLAARACCGGFYGGGNGHDGLLRSILSSCTRNTDLYHLVRRIEMGEGCDCLSPEFLDNYLRLDQILCRRFCASAGGGETEANRFAYSQNFPYVLFAGRDDDYFGFVLAVGHLLNGLRSSNGVLAKGAISQARTIYRFVRGFSSRMKTFASSADGPCYWTNDMFQLFLCSENGMQEEFLKIVSIFVADKSEG